MRKKPKKSTKKLPPPPKGILSHEETKSVVKRLKWLQSPFLRKLYFRFNPFAIYPRFIGTVDEIDCGTAIVQFSAGGINHQAKLTVNGKYGYTWDSPVSPHPGDKIHFCGLFVKANSGTKAIFFAWPE